LDNNGDESVSTLDPDRVVEPGAARARI
jgi:hypothetical protein